MGMLGLIFTALSLMSLIGFGVSAILIVVGVLLSPRRIPEGRRLPVVRFLVLGILMVIWGFAFNYIAWSDVNAETWSMFFVAIVVWCLGGFFLASFSCQYYFEHRPVSELPAPD